MSLFGHKHLLGLEDLSREEIEHVLDTAESLRDVSERDIKKVPALRGKTVVNLFFEPSTRTRTSFELAAKRLSADAVNIAGASSSQTKGETLLDMVRNIEGMRPDAVVIRHRASGAPRFVAERVGCPVVNAGDGAHEHPTQGLLDLLTIRRGKGRVEGLTVVIAGDIVHSRVARSALFGLKKLGARVRLCGPPTMIPAGIEKLGAEVSYNLSEAVEGADVIMMLRIQLERMENPPFPSLREYAQRFGLNRRILERAGPEALVMHPGPVNRGVEMSSEVADGLQSVILEQVTNGVAVRMAILFLLAGGGQAEKAEKPEGEGR